MPHPLLSNNRALLLCFQKNNDLPRFDSDAETATVKRFDTSDGSANHIATSRRPPPRARAAVLRSLRRFASSSRTAASLHLGAPHVGLAPDDPVLFLLHLPPRTKLGFLERTGDEVSLRFLAAVIPEELELGEALHALGDAAQPHAV